MELIDIAKEKVKLIDYIEGNKKNSGKWTFIDPCPKCGGKNHFVIRNDSNTFSSFSKCCKGGSIIDYLLEIENFGTISECITRVLEIAGLEENKKTASNVKKIKEERLKKSKQNKLITLRFNLLYHKLTNYFKIASKIPIDEQTSLMMWLLDFIDRYTSLMIENNNDYYFVENFKKLFEMEYKNFLKWEDEFNAYGK